MIDLRTITTDEAITAMLTVDGLRVRADELHPGDAIVYQREGVYHSTTVESVDPATDGLTITTVSGDAWSCARANRGQLRITERI